MTELNALPNAGSYNLILADPPWRYSYAVETEGQCVEQHYDTMPVEAICELPVQSVAAKDCVLFLWATAPKLPEAMQVMKAWGFTYKTCMVWVKTYASGKVICGMGYYARVAHEMVLIGTRGKPGVPAVPSRPCSVFVAQRGRHSAKPECHRWLLEQMYPKATRLEMFARGDVRTGWDVWGAEAEQYLVEGDADGLCRRVSDPQPDRLYRHAVRAGTNP